MGQCAKQHQMAMMWLILDYFLNEYLWLVASRYAQIQKTMRIAVLVIALRENLR